MDNIEDIRRRLENRRDALLKEIEQVNKLLSAFDEAEQYLSPKNGTQPALALTPPVISGRPATTSIRIRKALLRMPDTFTTNDLWASANSDGGPPIDKRKTFAPYVTKMKKDGEVVEVQGPMGNTPGIYRKGDISRTKTLIDKFERR